MVRTAFRAWLWDGKRTQPHPVFTTVFSLLFTCFVPVVSSFSHDWVHWRARVARECCESYDVVMCGFACLGHLCGLVGQT